MRRRYAGKRRSAPRRRPTRTRKTQRRMPRMGRRSILNVTSTKKMDTLMTVTAAGTHVVNMQPGTTASGVSATLWSPTALMLASPNVSSVSARTAHTVFWRGIQENISLKTDTSDPFPGGELWWSWIRRLLIRLFLLRSTSAGLMTLLWGCAGTTLSRNDRSSVIFSDWSVVDRYGE